MQSRDGPTWNLVWSYAILRFTLGPNLWAVGFGTGVRSGDHHFFGGYVAR
jgi:hypothetical protein